MAQRELEQLHRFEAVAHAEVVRSTKPHLNLGGSPLMRLDLHVHWHSGFGRDLLQVGRQNVDGVFTDDLVAVSQAYVGQLGQAPLDHCPRRRADDHCALRRFHDLELFALQEPELRKRVLSVEGSLGMSNRGLIELAGHGGASGGR